MLRRCVPCFSCRLATSEDQVRRAMEHPQTGAYDVCRHERLRQRYVSVYLSEDEEVAGFAPRFHHWWWIHRGIQSSSPSSWTREVIFDLCLLVRRTRSPRKRRRRPSRSALPGQRLCWNPPELESGVLVVDDAPGKEARLRRGLLCRARAPLHEPPFLHWCLLWQQMMAIVDAGLHWPEVGGASGFAREATTASSTS